MKLKKLKCLRCKKEWFPRVEKRPEVCPKCKSYKWDIPKSEEKK